MTQAGEPPTRLRQVSTPPPVQSRPALWAGGCRAAAGEDPARALLARRRHAPAGYPLRPIVEEVSRIDSPAQSSRRFVVQEGRVAGTPMRAGDAIVVLLAAADHDPAANPQPERFDPNRSPCQNFTFGLGAHACLGRQLAVAIATQGVALLLGSGLDPRRLPAQVSYRPSLARRVPVLDATTPVRIAPCSTNS